VTGNEERDGVADNLHKAMLDATFSGFFSRHRVDVERFLSSRERDRGMIEDVTQEAFAAARQKWEVVQDYDKPLAWVHFVARRKLSDHQKRRHDRPMEYLGDDIAEQAFEPGNSQEAEEIVTALLQRLPPRLAEVMRLSLDGWNGHEIAGMTSLAYNTVRTYLAEARRRMQQLAEEDGYSEPAGRSHR
jgi:RNA polymerase sigma-70 factor (ECF subfamily)